MHKCLAAAVFAIACAAIGWQVNAAVPIGAVLQAAPNTPIQLVNCKGDTGNDGCPAGKRYLKDNGQHHAGCYPCPTHSPPG